MNAANTWEYKTVTFAGDTAFGITNDNGATGWIRVYWVIGGDPAKGWATADTSNAWFTASGTKRALSTATNATVANATFQITGAQFERGSTASAFEYRPIGTELALCQRYFYKMSSPATCAQGFGHNQSTTQMRILFPTPVEMRTTPTFASLGSLGLASGGTSFIASAASVLGISSNGVHAEFTVSGATTHQTSVYRDSSGVTFNAEL